MNTVAIVGASGYIGRHLVEELARDGGFRIKILTRTQTVDLSGVAWSDHVEVIKGDLRDEVSLHEFLEPGCTVINLAYLWSEGELTNLVVIKNLLSACKDRAVRRLIHCSTAAVVGRVSDDHITENTECRPITEYGVTKLKIESEIIRASKGVFESVILRPTGVFGPGSEPLKKLARDLVGGSFLQNYFKSCLFGKRRMNLVNIVNVVAAILFLIRYFEPTKGEIFIVSDDEASSNNFVDVERFLMHSLNCTSYPLPRVHLPLSVLSLLLKFLGRNNINPRSNYTQEKLEGIGFRSPVAFSDGLAAYAEWYKSTYLVARGGMAR